MAISVSSRLLHWQNQGPEGRHRSRRQGLPGGWDSEWGEQAANMCKSRCRKEDKQTSEADFLYSWILLRPQPRRLKAWIPTRTVYTGSHLLFSPARWPPIWGCDPRVAVGIYRLGELTLTREKQLCLLSLTQLATYWQRSPWCWGLPVCLESYQWALCAWISSAAYPVFHVKVDLCVEDSPPPFPFLQRRWVFSLTFCDLQVAEKQLWCLNVI